MTVSELATSQGLTLARDVEQRVGDWLVWFGRASRHFWAMSLADPRPELRHDHLVEAASAEELLRKLVAS